MDEVQKILAAYAAQSVEQRSRWFSPAAEAYAATRPRYPQSMLEEVLGQAELTATSTVLEVGCGPATATLALAELGCRIVALEPNSDFFAIAREACQGFPQVELINTSFEAWEPRGESFDAVVAATSFHWVPAATGYPKVASVLRPSGWLILLWNKELKPPAGTHGALRSIVRRHSPELDRPYEEAATVAGILKTLGQSLQKSPLFQGVHFGQLECQQFLSIDDYLTLLTTYSPFLALEPQVRDALLADLRPTLETSHAGGVPLTYTSAFHMAQRQAAGPGAPKA